MSLLIVLMACSGSGDVPAGDSSGDTSDQEIGADDTASADDTQGVDNTGGSDDTGAAGDCTGGSGWSARSDILQVGGATAYVKVPEGLPACAPLVVYGHGSNAPGGYLDGEWLEVLNTGLADLAEARGFVLIAPGVADAPENTHSWSTSAQGVAEVESLVQAAWDNADIDRRRTWFMGQSAGGFMAGYLGLYAPGTWAGIGVISGGLVPYYYDYPSPEPDPKLPFYIAHDPNDAFVDYAYGQALADALDDHGHVYAFEQWELGGNGHVWAEGLTEATLDWLAEHPPP